MKDPALWQGSRPGIKVSTLSWNTRGSWTEAVAMNNPSEMKRPLQFDGKANITACGPRGYWVRKGRLWQTRTPENRHNTVCLLAASPFLCPAYVTMTDPQPPDEPIIMPPSAVQTGRTLFRILLKAIRLSKNIKSVMSVCCAWPDSQNMQNLPCEGVVLKEKQTELRDLTHYKCVIHEPGEWNRI